jgi:site-specific DNA recombinase
LRNRFYIGEVVFKSEVLTGEQPVIIDRKLFAVVQARLSEQVSNHKISRTKSEALLLGRIFDDRGNRMTPSHARKGGIKYRYYLSSALLQGLAERVGSVRRVPAADIEALVTKAVREHIELTASIDDRSLIADHVARVEVRPDRLLIELANAKGNNPKRPRSRKVLNVPWHKTPSKSRREILLPDTAQAQHARPIRSETRATLVASIARGRRWLNELSTDPTTSAESIAKRERCSVRQVNMTISLAFLAPNLVRAAIEGRLPRGIGVTRLRDAPAEWSRQHAMLGLPH